ncbi:TPA: ATP-grasp domain-containing protein [Serratia fonticola]
MTHLVFLETTRPGIQAIEQALQLGYQVTNITSHQFDWLLPAEELNYLRSLPCSVIEVSDSHNSEVIEDALSKCLARGPINGVLSTLHQCVEPLALAASRLGLHASSARAIQIARDKGLCRARLKEHKLRSVDYEVVQDFSAARDFVRKIGYPVIVKPSTGMGKVLTAILYDEVQLLEHFVHIEQSIDLLPDGIGCEISNSFIVEEVAQGPLYSIELAVSTSGKWSPLMITRRKVGAENPVFEMGTSVPSGLNDEEYQQAAEYAIAIGKALGFNLGFLHIEFIMTNEGPCLVEVNPRIAGGSIPDLIRQVTGVNLFEQLVKLYAGEEIEYSQLKPKYAASHTFICAQEDAIVREDLEEEWFEEFRPRLIAGSTDILPGMAVRKMDGNYALYGVFRAQGSTFTEAEQACREIHREIERKLGIKLYAVAD